MNNMVLESTPDEQALFSTRFYEFDRLDYIIEILNNIVNTDECAVEKKVIAFEKLGVIHWYNLNDTEMALEYMNKAIDLADSTSISFNFIVRGHIWRNKLQFLELLAKEDEIINEIDRIIAKFKNSKFNSNSYLYNAYKCKANMEYKNGSFKEALDFLITAYSYYPIKFYFNRAKNSISLGDSDYKNTYDNLNRLLSRKICHIKNWEL